jgi:hypothetical protein
LSAAGDHDHRPRRTRHRGKTDVQRRNLLSPQTLRGPNIGQLSPPGPQGLGGFGPVGVWQSRTIEAGLNKRLFWIASSCRRPKTYTRPEVVGARSNRRKMTPMYGPAARCKRFSSSCRFAVLHQCIRPLIGAFAPGHHGYQRACVLISGQASTGPWGSPVFACAGKTDPPSLLIPLADLGWKLLIGLCHRLLLISPSSFVRPRGRSFVPACRRRSRRAQGRSRPAVALACGGLRRCQAAP